MHANRQSGGLRAEISTKSAIRGAHWTLDVDDITAGGPESPTSDFELMPGALPGSSMANGLHHGAAEEATSETLTG